MKECQLTSPAKSDIKGQLIYVYKCKNTYMYRHTHTHIFGIYMAYIYIYLWHIYIYIYILHVGSLCTLSPIYNKAGTEYDNSKKEINRHR